MYKYCNITDNTHPIVLLKTELPYPLPDDNDTSNPEGAFTVISAVKLEPFTYK